MTENHNSRDRDDGGWRYWRDRAEKYEAERDGYRMALEIVWEAITPTMMEEQLANFIAGYVRTALDNPAAPVLRETHDELVKKKALDR